MKILILQLARFGDIYTTWPAVHALQRTHEGCEVHLLVRKRFKSATEGLANVRVHEFDTESFLNPLANGDIPRAVGEFDRFCDSMKSQSFDVVCNLSYSPFSSYLCSALSSENTSIYGYTRHSDGHLALPDDVSAYFYAQVGIGRHNRTPLAEIFAAEFGLQLEEGDWRVDEFPSSDLSLPKPYFVVHLGASQRTKTYPVERFATAVSLAELPPGFVPVVIGSAEETDLAEHFERQTPGTLNLCGKTRISDLLSIVQGSRFVVGADSAPIHIASLCGVPVLNMSFGNVNLWETGPRSAGSRILFARSPDQMDPYSVAREITSLAKDAPPVGTRYYINAQREIVDLVGETSEESAWIQAIYFDGEVPKGNPETISGLSKLHEVNTLALENLYALQRNPGDGIASSILTRVDEIIQVIDRLVPNLGPLVRWFQTERIRIPPGPLNFVLNRTLDCHLRLQDLLHKAQRANLDLPGVRNGKSVLDR